MRSAEQEKSAVKQREPNDTNGSLEAAAKLPTDTAHWNVRKLDVTKPELRNNCLRKWSESPILYNLEGAFTLQHSQGAGPARVLRLRRRGEREEAKAVEVHWFDSPSVTDSSACPLQHFDAMEE
ncbi:unnamed protein product [Caretta caretta]